MRISTFRRLLALASFATAGVYAQVTASQNKTGQSPAAAAVLDRYVEVTGGASAYKKINASVWEITTTASNGSSAHLTMFQSRDGREQEDIEVGGKLQGRGVSNGIAWEYTEATGARILSGEEAARRVTAASVFLEDDWRKHYPTAAVAGEEAVEGAPCIHIRLVRTDGAIRDLFYDKKTGLLQRQVMRDDEGDKNAAVMTVVRYGQSDGLKYPEVIRSEQNGIVQDVKVDSVRFSAKPPSDAFVLPDKVLLAVAELKHTSGMPSAVDLLERYIAQTGGKGQYAALKTQKVTGEMSLASADIKGKLALYQAAGGKLYTSIDLPGAGKFESGSDGKTTWERSVLLGPRIVPRSEGSRGMLGPGPDQIISLLRASEGIETVGKDEAGGAPCWSVRIRSRDTKEPPTTMCFDVASGYLTHLTGTSKTQMGTAAIDLTMSNYQDDGGIKSPHHLETQVSGQALQIDITEVVLNGPLPEDTFDIPSEIKALAARKLTATDEKEGPLPDRPTLRRSR